MRMMSELRWVTCWVLVAAQISDKEMLELLMKSDYHVSRKAAAYLLDALKEVGGVWIKKVGDKSAGVGTEEAGKSEGNGNGTSTRDEGGKRSEGARTTVIVCSYGGQEELVAGCIDSLERQTYVPDEVILVVDTEAEKESYSNLLCSRTHVAIKVISSGKTGLAAARNKGVETASGDIITFIDDDAEADENWLFEIVNSFSKGVKVVGGHVKPVFRGKKLDSKLNWVIDCTTTNPPPKRPIGCNMAFAKRVFEVIGGFDESLGMVRRKMAVGEETNLFLRIKKRYGPDAKIMLNPDAVVYHHVPEERTKWRYMLRRAHAEGLAKARIGKEYDLDVEQTYLKYYLKHLDVLTFFLLLGAGAGYLRGKLR